MWRRTRGQELPSEKCLLSPFDAKDACSERYETQTPVRHSERHVCNSEGIHWRSQYSRPYILHAGYTIVLNFRVTVLEESFVVLTCSVYVNSGIAETSSQWRSQSWW